MWTPSRPLGMTSGRRLGAASHPSPHLRRRRARQPRPMGPPKRSWAQGLVGAGTPEDGFHHGKKEALRGAPTAPSIDPSLNDPETVKYRETYRRHRRQGTEMLEHAARSPNLRSTPGPAGSPILRCESGNLEDVVEEPSGGVHGMSEMYEDEKGYSRLLRWRLALLQAHRLGKARGAQTARCRRVARDSRTRRCCPWRGWPATTETACARARPRRRRTTACGGARARGLPAEAGAGARAARAGARRGGEQGRDRAAQLARRRRGRASPTARSSASRSTA